MIHVAVHGVNFTVNCQKVSNLTMLPVYFYAEGYIVFTLLFIRMYVCSFVLSWFWWISVSMFLMLNRDVELSNFITCPRTSK